MLHANSSVICVFKQNMSVIFIVSCKNVCMTVLNEPNQNFKNFISPGKNPITNGNVKVINNHNFLFLCLYTPEVSHPIQY